MAQWWGCPQQWLEVLLRTTVEVLDLLALLVNGGLSLSHPDRAVVAHHGSERHGGLLVQCW